MIKKLQTIHKLSYKIMEKTTQKFCREIGQWFNSEQHCVKHF